MEMLYQQSAVFMFTQNLSSVFQMNYYLSAFLNHYENKLEPETTTNTIPTTLNY